MFNATSPGANISCVCQHFVNIESTRLAKASQRTNARTETLMSVEANVQQEPDCDAPPTYLHIVCNHYQVPTPSAPVHPDLCEAKFKSRSLDRRSCGCRGNAPACTGASLLHSCSENSIGDRLFHVDLFGRWVQREEPLMMLVVHLFSKRWENIHHSSFSPVFPSCVSVSGFVSGFRSPPFMPFTHRNVLLRLTKRPP